MATASDLGTRALSGAIMIAIAGAMLWIGGWPFTALVVTAAAIGWWELVALARRQRGTTIIGGAGAAYIALAVFGLVLLRSRSLTAAMIPIAGVVATDIGAYFAGRTFGGPKIAPAISPSKTWSGLAGGMVASAATWLAVSHFTEPRDVPVDAVAGLSTMMSGAVFAIVAQAGDFLESWLKRRAGVKDSGTLIPGHGGILDRIDGLLAVLFVLAMLNLLGRA